MPRVCTICSHPERPAIEQELATGGSLRGIARKRGLSEDALARHRNAHLSVAVVAAVAEVRTAGNLSATARIELLISKGLALCETAEKSGKLQTAVSALGQLRGLFELLGRFTGELNGTPKDAPELPPFVVTRKPETEAAESGDGHGDG